MCRKLIFSFILLTVVTLSVYSQNKFDRDVSNTIRVFDANGKIFVNPNIDIAGTPFFIEEWKYGNIVLDNVTYFNWPLRINLHSQEVHFLSKNNIEMNFAAGLIKELILFDTTLNIYKQYSFQSGFPSIDNQDQKDLYRVICNGKIKLLEYLRKKIIVEKDGLSGEVKKEYRTYENYYFFTGAAIMRIKKDKAYLFGILKDKKEKIEEFIRTNNLNYKSVLDIIKITDYYNSLQ
jgi:hypothetical protein